MLARARSEDPDARAARQHSGRRLRIWTANDGMVEGHFRVTPEVGGGLKANIDAETQRIFRARRKSGPHESHEAYAADALDNLLIPQPNRSGGERLGGEDAGDEAESNGHERPHRDRPHRARARNALEGEQCEIPGVGPVNVAWVREMLGDAFVTAVIKKGRDITTVAHFGRHIPAHLRTAMIVAGRECCIEGCHARGYLEIDHSEIDHAQGGTRRLVEPRLRLLHPPRPQNPRLETRTPPPQNRKTNPHTTTRSRVTTMSAQQCRGCEASAGAPDDVVAYGVGEMRAVCSASTVGELGNVVESTCRVVAGPVKALVVHEMRRLGATQSS